MDEGNANVPNGRHLIAIMNLNEEYYEIVSVATKQCPDMIPEATKAHERHTQSLSLFGKCHRGYNGGVVTNSDIDQIGMLKINYYTLIHACSLQSSTSVNFLNIN